MADEIDTSPEAIRAVILVLSIVANGRRNLSPEAAGTIAEALTDLAAERDALRQRAEKAEAERDEFFKVVQAVAKADRHPTAILQMARAAREGKDQTDA